MADHQCCDRTLSPKMIFIKGGLSFRDTLNLKLQYNQATSILHKDLTQFLQSLSFCQQGGSSKDKMEIILGQMKLSWVR